MKRSIYSFVAVLLVISTSGVALAANAAAAMLRSNGGVSVNGSPVNSVTTVFAGDRIETAPQSGASLTVNGSSLLMDPNSSMLFSGEDMNFYCGGGTIQTGQGLTARFGRMAVKPAKGTARFQVQQTGAELKVSALDGDLSVFDGEKTINLMPGNSASVPNLGCGQLAKNIPQGTLNNGVTNSPAPNAPPNSPPIAGTQTPVHVYTRGMWVAPSAVTGVAVTGIILLRQQQPVSPSNP